MAAGAAVAVTAAATAAVVVVVAIGAGAAVAAPSGVDQQRITHKKGRLRGLFFHWSRG
jgi:pyocin large subunit-like protein